MLWRIDGSDVYLLGTIHFGNFDWHALPESVRHAYDRSASIVLEADTRHRPSENSLLIGSGQTLDKLVSAAVWASVSQSAARLGLDAGRIGLFWPIITAMTLTFTEAARSGYTEAGGIDQLLRERATADGKRLEWLEALNDQLGIVTGTPMLEQVSHLAYLSEQPELGVSEVRELLSAWRTGDRYRFELVLEEKRQRWPEIFKAVIEQRNIDWVPKIERLLAESSPRLVAVGSLHLVGDHGVPSLLQGRGHILTEQAWR
ncbi:TraB/GumN family protein [Paraburkholderia phenoliruptrix]|uniref:TraB/GumN family protein n=1 Tax=Paraburkholderia phenoliruptrix TaxID=252970 RepID=UPI002869BB68|nr:TraB/GumN family protein [Paraburkholderia phenoliruptrix]WMY11759.1 TraB/GumN family protein [Paraburkholderia phenoliruptrix]